MTDRGLHANPSRPRSAELVRAGSTRLDLSRLHPRTARSKSAVWPSSRANRQTQWAGLAAASSPLWKLAQLPQYAAQSEPKYRARERLLIRAEWSFHNPER